MWWNLEIFVRRGGFHLTKLKLCVEVVWLEEGIDGEKISGEEREGNFLRFYFYKRNFFGLILVVNFSEV